MKMQTWYELWISYGNNKWYNLKRPFESYPRALEIADRIAGVHKYTTRIAVVTVMLQRATSVTVEGKLANIKGHFYNYCKSCGSKRKNSNINKEGNCVSCEMRKAIA